MNWLYYINNKAKIASILTIIVILILGKNILDKNNVTKLGKTFNEVYTDRLMVESYILKLSNLYHTKIIDMYKLTSYDELSRYKQTFAVQNNEISNLINEYEKTKLTEKEFEYIALLKKESDMYLNMENKWVKNMESNRNVLKDFYELETSGHIIIGHLNDLSKIQIEEGTRLNENSKSIVSNSLILTYFELGIIVIIALIIQAMIFATKTVLKSKNKDAHLWN